MSILAAEVETMALRVENISLHYGAAQALRGVSLSAPIGQVTAVMGRNGVGKTSLMRAITGRERISAGRIRLGETDLTRMAPFARARAGVASCPQGREIFPLLSVRENLETGFAGLPHSQRKVPDEVYDLFPILQEMANRRGGDLSGGQQQQLAIGRALVTRPRLLVLDEPTEGIQPSVIKDIGRAIRYLRDQRRMAILLVEQYVDFALDLADQITVLERGAVVMQGEAAALDHDALRRAIAV
ncbi:urea ABC transporter ATP-binding subunit UrtE [Paracoccus sp. (in: a-proteobacteria)]|uniref:urea ABC transporter ATP-binding subunit UrtE n=1 Tax=Paracoccus sp. TaxID=267 RepID=UPI0035AF43A6